MAAARASAADIPSLDRLFKQPALAVLLERHGHRPVVSYGDEVELAPTLTAMDKALLTDPQTSGGLLVACERDALHSVLQTLRQCGFASSACVGVMIEGDRRVLVDS